jgi:hypothetical protein
LLLPKKLEEYNLGYSQGIGLSHKLLPDLRSMSFGSGVARDKVSFLKE